MFSDLHLDRRTGGLESPEYTAVPHRLLDRRTGGLEREVINNDKSDFLDRRTGGLGLTGTVLLNHFSDFGKTGTS